VAGDGKGAAAAETQRDNVMVDMAAFDRKQFRALKMS